MTSKEIDLEFSKNFSEKLAEAKSVILGTEGMVRLISHYDPDGMSSAAIMAKALTRAGKKFHITLTSKLGAPFMEEVKKEKFDLVIFTDMGSGLIETLETFERNVVVVDHHAPQKEGSKPVVHLNPHLFGFDGAREACGATMSFFLAVTLSDENWDLAPLALAGAVGDRQNLGGFSGYNDQLVAAAVNRELIKREKVLDLRGQTIMDSLLNHPEPYFKGLNGDKKAIKKFLKAMGLDETAAIKELDDEKKRHLASTLSLHLLKQGASTEAINQLVTNRYWLYDRHMYVDELVPLLNACGRRKKYSLGLALALGSKEAMEEARKVHGKHISWIMDTMGDLEKNQPDQLDNIQYIHVRESTYSGVMAGLGTLYLFDKSKPVIGIFSGDDKSHISARATRSLVEKGLDLGAACKNASEQVGGTGGGHNIASGAKVPSKKEKKFLTLLDKVVGEQLAS
ncbi:MAG: DHH family phosphoesterase [Thermoplasmata archaeon]|nr:DHH family phosphoesterase [Thermoplasmata archaeon]